MATNKIIAKLMMLFRLPHQILSVGFSNFTFNSFAFRHAASITIAMVLALVVNYYVSFSETGWLVLAAFLVGQTTRGTPLRQGFTAFFAINLAFLLAMCLGVIFSPFEVLILIAIIFTASFLFALFNRASKERNSYRFLIFGVSLLAVIPMPEQSWQSIRMAVIDIAIGSGIGILCNQFIFRISVVREFSEGITPVLKQLNNYNTVLTNALVKKTDDVSVLLQAKIQVEKILVVQQDMYPEWIYEVGFNPGLRSGFRFFLLTIERATEIFFSLDYYAYQEINKDWLKMLIDSIEFSMEKNSELIKILIAYFAENKLLETHSDFTSDITALEVTLKKIVPDQLELLDIMPDYMMLTSLVRDIKDLRQLLLQLVTALPS